MKMTLPDAQSRAAMLSTGMEQGMEASYARFELQVAGIWERMLSEAQGPYTIVAMEPQQTAAVKFTVGLADMPTAERSARTKLVDALSRLGTVAAGDRFTLCRSLTDGKMHYEPGVVVSRTFTSSGMLLAPNSQAVAQPSMSSSVRSISYRKHGLRCSLGALRRGCSSTTMYALLA